MLCFLTGYAYNFADSSLSVFKHALHTHVQYASDKFTKEHHMHSRGEETSLLYKRMDE